MSDLPPSLCPDCEHSVNAHVFEFDFERYFCGGTYGDCGCRLGPSDIARALLNAEPTEAEVKAAADAIRRERAFMAAAAFGVPLNALPECCELIARAALRAAREARA